MKFQTAFVAILTVYLVNQVLNSFGVYGFFPNIDIPMHFLGGFTMSMLGYALYQKGIKKQKLPEWFAYLFIVSFGLFIGVFWEIHEWILDHTIHTWRHVAFSQSSNDDTMKDLLDDWLGASVSYLTFRKSKIQKQP
ncbi:MAG: hypothetical protein NTX72_03200 [Candidatus Uhrbacteria bacterium]|nr:hypothetical protein [Candidatus Uhrbacteria bacterium]